MAQPNWIEQLRQQELKAWYLAPVVLIAIVAVAFFGWIQPKMSQDAALQKFHSPEAQAQRDPDTRQVSPEFVDAVQRVREKYATEQTPASTLRSDRKSSLQNRRRNEEEDAR